MVIERALFPDMTRDFGDFQKYCRLLDQGRGGPDGRPRFTRIYGGAEFCVNRLPSAAMTAAVAAMCGDSGLKFTLVLPPVHDTSFSKVDRIVAMMRPGTEIVINDWAMLEPALAAGCVPVMGRALNRLVRDPRIGSDGRTPQQIEFLQTSQAHLPMVREFIKGRGIARLELDNVRQGLALMPDDGLPASLYTPWTLISVSRFCGSAYAAHCPGKPCFATRTFVEGVPIIADGTCTFWFNAGMPREMAGIDRLVHVTGPEGLGWLVDELSHPAWDEVEMPRLQSGGEVAVNDPVERIVMQALTDEFKSVCHIGCGFGAHLEVLDRMAKKLTGIDASMTALDIVRRRVPSATRICGTAADIAGGPFDLVLDPGFLNDSPDRPAAARRVVESLADGGLYLTSAADENLDELKILFVDSLAFVWQHKSAVTGRNLVLLRHARPDHDAECRLAGLVEAFLNKGFDSHDIDFVDLTAFAGRTPAAPSLTTWISVTAGHKLADLGFKYLWRELEGEGRTMFRLAHADYRIELEFSPVSQNRPSYRNCGAHNVAYHGSPPDMSTLDAAIDILAPLA